MSRESQHLTTKSLGLGLIWGKGKFVPVYGGGSGSNAQDIDGHFSTAVPCSSASS